MGIVTSHCQALQREAVGMFAYYIDGHGLEQPQAWMILLCLSLVLAYHTTETVAILTF